MKPKIKMMGICCLFFWGFASTFLLTGIAVAQGWTRHYIKQLPDESFAVVEIDNFGRRHRHCPYRDANGTIDNEQLIYVLGTMERETWVDAENKILARKRLEQHYQREMNSRTNSGVVFPININTASLSELVHLPHIGPVLAVNIAEYREEQAAFGSIEAVRRVDGVGQGTLDAIRYYVRFE
jgi:competence ComEA-like helix-hairpin-helix protein